jgi:tetratricopeptide (TPR) repeat protein
MVLPSLCASGAIMDEDVEFEDNIELARSLLGSTEEGVDLWEANDACNRALTLRPVDPHAWLLKCQILSALDDDCAALASAEMALRRAPRLAEAHYWRGAVLGDLARHDEALKAIDRAFRCLTPEDDWLLEDLYYEKASMLDALGRRDAAVAIYEAGLERCPESAILKAGLEPLRRQVVRSTFKVINGGLS